VASTVEVEGYLVIAPTHVSPTDGCVTRAKFSKVTGRPPVMEGDERAVKITVRIPSSVFEPVAQIDVIVPEGDVIKPEVVVG
jgi:hypothetical protein